MRGVTSTSMSKATEGCSRLTRTMNSGSHVCTIVSDTPSRTSPLTTPGAATARIISARMRSSRSA
jgi:hypothetical protein